MAEYTDMRLEGLLSAAIDRSVPDLREEAATRAVSPLGAPDGIVPVQTRRSVALRHTVMGLAACLVLVLGLSSFAFFRPLSVIGIDVNPSIELTANYFDRVLSITPLNEDAVKIIGDMDLKYVDLDIAVNALVGSMALHGYFESGQDVAVLVSVTGGSENHNLTLQRKLAADIETAANAAGARASVYTQNTDKAPTTPPAPPVSPVPAPSSSQSPAPSVSLSPSPAPSQSAEATPSQSVAPSQSTKPSPSPATPTQPVTPPRPATAQERAAQNGISYGKQVFIDKLLALDPTLSESELAAMPIGKIASLAKQRGLDISGIVDYDPDDSIKENIEDFIDDLDDPEDDDDDKDDKEKSNNGNHNGWDKDDDDDDEDDD